MKRALVLAALLSLSLLSGCDVQSVHPLYTERELADDPALLGVWAEKDSTETWTFTRREGGQFDLLFIDEDEKKNTFLACLVKAGGHTFLDLYPNEGSTNNTDFFENHLFLVHSFVLVVQTTPTLKIVPVDPDWLVKHLEKNPGTLRHENVPGLGPRGDVLLTASPKELQTFFAAHVGDKGAWGDTMELYRKIAR